MTVNNIAPAHSAARAPTQIMFITPPTNSSVIIGQQQLRQKSPCRRPILRHHGLADGRRGVGTGVEKRVEPGEADGADDCGHHDRAVAARQPHDGCVTAHGRRNFKEPQAATPAGVCSTFASELWPSDTLNLSPPVLSMRALAISAR